MAKRRPLVTVVTPTWLEYLAARLCIRSARIVRSGVGHRLELVDADTIITCGLAGGLDPNLPSGAVVVSTSFASKDGEISECAESLYQAMIRGAMKRRVDVHPVRLVTVDHVVDGPEREDLADRGFQAVDMETSLYSTPGVSVLSVRTILDTPARALSPEWLRPTTALTRPRLWPQLIWLAWASPRYAIRAARVVEGGLRELS